jgi:hypothetical protein
MTTTARQNNLILNQDWTRIYQTFKNADFKSYDFENLRRVIISYLRENYPEDFNDYIESSEYLALIDAVAFLGQSLAFRIDLASRENFIELAERRESVLRLARMLSYNPKRNIPAMGILKFDTVSTTESIFDGTGRNLAQQTIVWDDPTNPNWPEQFITVLNAAMADNTEFGRSQGSSVVQGIPTEQYRFRTFSSDVPIFNFTKIVASRQMIFEIVSTGFKGAEQLYEEPPVPGNQLGFIYRNDNRGGSSANTGFFMMFKQGSLELADFNIDIPTTNEIIAVDSNNINNDDVWLYALNSRGLQDIEWTKVSNLIGNNIAYNSINANIRNIYSVITKENDRIDLAFADGVYGNLPQGAFRVYYRVSNGLVYQVSPSEMRGISITVPYLNSSGVQHTLTISMSLKYTVNTASARETTNSIRVNAPAQYYVQNRMITGEDYNLAPLTSSQNILKVKAVNRTSSGISRNFDIIDASGKYSNVNVFADDGLIYKQEIEKTISFKFISRAEVFNFIKEKVEPLFTSTDVYNFYLTKFEKIFFAEESVSWIQVTSDVNNSSGYFVRTDDNSVLTVGFFATNILRFVTPGMLIKFVPPNGKAFKNGVIVDQNANDSAQCDCIWTKVVNVAGDGTADGTGILTNGTGAVKFSDIVPSGALAQRVIPKFVSNLSDALEVEIINQMVENQTFGLNYNITEQNWEIVTSDNIDLVSNFSLGKSGDVTNSNLDSSWIVAFVRKADQYVIRVRGIEYIFSSIEQNRFYFDSSQKIYDSRTGQVLKDQVKVLGINPDSGLTNSLKRDVIFNIDDSITYSDGFQSTNEIKLAFSDKDDDGVIDNPESFEQIVGSDENLKYLFFLESVDGQGNITRKFIDNSNNQILIFQSENSININDFDNNQLIYFYSDLEDVVKRVNRTTNTLILESNYRGFIGRDKLKFQYLHNAGADRRIDPSVSNIIDIYLLIRNYDTEYRNFIAGISPEPVPPTSDSLRIDFSRNLNLIKAISDEIIYHPVRYKVLFGSNAEPKLQAQFKVVKNPNRSINDNDLKVRIINAVDEFFDINNWDFGDRFYVSELITYIINSVSPDVSNMVLVPRQPDQPFSSLFEIQSKTDEIFISSASVDDINIVTAISVAEIGFSAISSNPIVK